MHRTSRMSFSELPLEAKAGLILLLLAWLSFLGVQAIISGGLSVIQLTMGGLCCLLVFSLRSWGRWLCGIYNAVLVFSMLSRGPEAFGGMLPLGAVAGLFAAATLALFLPATAAVFRQSGLKRP